MPRSHSQLSQFMNAIFSHLNMANNENYELKAVCVEDIFKIVVILTVANFLPISIVGCIASFVVVNFSKVGPLKKIDAAQIEKEFSQSTTSSRDQISW
ncbi:hypothetical protein RO3G_07911 [Rhizopus delemar RA 99-880]|uniref:Uncharacterized protein n=1 Tax=Rhizopus delemar (strain RA 99-880 / ATCC MYA-4621 / FGSC 9543 / NRRL 43880) TaxID=246409 RepID=I1C426_RHIO9|nr:hypothetical protein RO3G_07911 [Rhizopus delemar RA 99-880]|eukprot:EIE83206.1 hypothetical protein RO3G_07911 [Rhizopus delemar RA 99-880]